MFCELSRTSMRGCPIARVSTLESYIEGNLVIHVHAGRSCGKDPDPSEFGWCISLEPPPWGDVFNAVGGDMGWRERLSAHLGVLASNEDSDEGSMAMLIDVPEFLQYGKWLPLGSVLPCTKRLHLFDDRYKSAVHELQVPTETRGPVGGFHDHREGTASPRAIPRDGGRRLHSEPSLVVHTESPYEIVENSPDAVDDLADERSPLSGRGINQRLTTEDYLAGVRLLIGLDSIRVFVVNKRLDTAIQTLDIFIDTVQTGDEYRQSFVGHRAWEDYDGEGGR